MSDFNAKVGKKTDHESSMGNFGFGQRNKHGSSESEVPQMEIKLENSECFSFVDCAFCFRRENLKNMFERNESSSKYSTMIMNCFNIQVKKVSDDLKICELCIEQLSGALEFKHNLDSFIISKRSTKKVHKDNCSSDYSDLQLEFVVKNECLIDDYSNLEYFVSELKSEPDLECNEKPKSNNSIDFESDENINSSAENPDENPNGKSDEIRHLTKSHSEIYSCYIPSIEPSALICPVCKEKFDSHTLLLQHYPNHKPIYLCNICGDGFVDETSVIKHFSKHTSKKYTQQTTSGTKRPIDSLEDSEDEDSSNNENIPSSVRRRGLSRVWLFTKKYDDPKEAENVVREEGVWSITSTKRSIQGTRVEYRCKKGDYRTINECPAGLYILYHSESNHASIFKTDTEHLHINVEKERGLSEELKKFIKSKFEDGIEKPNSILALIKKANLGEPPKFKICNYLKAMRYTKYGKSSVSGGELRNWCEERIQIPVEEDTPFVLDYIVDCNSSNIDEQDPKIFISSKRLLNNMNCSQIIQIDATHKLIWQGYPVFVVGTSDRNQVFHPIGLGVSGNETASDYQFIFKSLKKFNLNWNPSILLADDSDAITQGFVDVFGTPKTRLMCYFHVLKSIEKHLKCLEEKNEIKNDINTLHTSKDDEVFKIGAELFIKKWEASENVKEFISYFKTQWLDQNECWYEGAAVGYPSTNSGIEATNSVLKKNQTFRERYPVGQFLNSLDSIINNWSTARNPQSPNSEEFCSVRNIPQKEWTDGYQWAVANKKVIKKEEPNFTIFHVCSSLYENESIDEMITEYYESYGKWESFDDFRKFNLGVWLILINKIDINASLCTCPYFLKHTSCKHLLGLKIRSKLVDVPKEAKLELKRKRGRPSSKSLKAIIV